FVSSRRRHTRLQGDWSSDVCSSDLADVVAGDVNSVAVDGPVNRVAHVHRSDDGNVRDVGDVEDAQRVAVEHQELVVAERLDAPDVVSNERRVFAHEHRVGGVADVVDLQNLSVVQRAGDERVVAGDGHGGGVCGVTVDDMRGAGGEVDGDEMRIAGDVGPAVHDHEVLDRLAGVIDGGSLSRQRMGGVEGEDLVGLAFEIVRIAGGGVEV